MLRNSHFRFKQISASVKNGFEHALLTFFFFLSEKRKKSIPLRFQLHQ